jgi:hypothetical protein
MLRLGALVFAMTIACTNRDAAKLCDKAPDSTCTCPVGSAFCADCSGPAQFVSKCGPEHGGACCTANADGSCACRPSACTADETQVAHCGLDSGGAFNPGGSGGGDPNDSGGDGFDGDTAGCTSIGFCRSGFDSCSCGSSCIHFGDGGFTCGYPCTTNADCTGRTAPVTGVPYTHCSQRVTTPTVTYDSYCQP